MPLDFYFTNNLAIIIDIIIHQLYICLYPVLGDKVLDFNNDGVSRHLGQIADKMCEWKGRIAEELGLTTADVAAINAQHPNDLKLRT